MVHARKIGPLKEAVTVSPRERGQPYRYGAHEDEVGGIFGPWEHEAAGIRHPVWVTRDGGKWRAMLNRLEVNVPLDESIFARPQKPR